MTTLGENPRLTLLKLVFEKPLSGTVNYLLDYIESDTERNEIVRTAKAIENTSYLSLFKDIKGFENLPEERQRELIRAAIDYTKAQGGGRAAHQKISSVEQCQEDVRKYGPTALRMWLDCIYEGEPYSEYQLIINGKYGH